MLTADEIKRLPPLRYPLVPLYWSGYIKTVCIASGPSLIREDADYCRGKARAVAVNDAWRMAPWADVLYACDSRWWNYHHGVPEFKGAKWTTHKDASSRWGLSYVQGESYQGLSFDRGLIHYGNNSGYQALNLAIHLGAREILLLGYDMQQSTDGKEHFFGDHPDEINSKSNYSVFIENFKTTVPDIARAGVRVINCSRETRLDCFPRARLKDVI